MFFIAGVSPKQRKLDFNQPVLCPECGKYGRHEIILEYNHLSLFFIPVLKWSKKYYVINTCCRSVYTIDTKLGDLIERGESIKLEETDLNLVHQGSAKTQKLCSSCGFETDENFAYCPNCAAPLK